MNIWMVWSWSVQWKQATQRLLYKKYNSVAVLLDAKKLRFMLNE